MLITNVTDFTCGNCKPVVEIRTESLEEDLYNVEPEFIKMVEIGRVYRNIDGFPNRWRIQNIGVVKIIVQTELV